MNRERRGRRMSSSSSSEDESENIDALIGNVSDDDDGDEEANERRQQRGDAADDGNPWGDEEDDAVDDPHPLEHYYTIMDIEEGGSTSRNTRSQTTTLMLHNWEDAYRPDRLFERIIGVLQQRLLDTHASDPPTMLGMELMNPRMNWPFYIPVRPFAHNTPATMAAAFETLMQSETELQLFQHPMDCRIFAIWRRRVERGGAGYSRSASELATKARSLVSVSNTGDVHCLLRSVLIGMMDADRRDGLATAAEYRRFTVAAGAEQNAAVTDALRCFDGTVLDEGREEGYDLEDAMAIQEFFDAHIANIYRLVVLQHTATHGTQLVWRGEKPARHSIHLFWERHHWAYIGEPKELFPGCRFYCADCDARLVNRRRHRLDCPAVCRRCLRSGYGFPCKLPANDVHSPLIVCDDCGFTFLTRDCYNHHRHRDRDTPGGRGGGTRKTVCEMKHAS